MEDRALGGTSETSAVSAPPRREGRRNIWVLTAYGISGLLLFGILAYYFSQYVTK